MSRPHRVERQTIEVAAPDEVSARAVMSRISAAYWRLEGAVERAMDRVDDPQAVFRIDRMEVTLPKCRLDSLEDTLAREIEKHVAEKLAAVLPGIHREPTEKEAAKAKAAPRDRAKQGVAGDAVELLRHFGETGRMPWWAKGDARAALRDALQAVLSAAASDGNLRDSTVRFLSDSTVRDRFVLQFDDAALTILLRILRPDFPGTEDGFARHIDRLTHGGVRRSEARRQVWNAVLVSGAPGKELLPVDPLPAEPARDGAIANGAEDASAADPQAGERGKLRPSTADVSPVRSPIEPLRDELTEGEAGKEAATPATHAVAPRVSARDLVGYESQGAEGHRNSEPPPSEAANIVNRTESAPPTKQERFRFARKTEAAESASEESIEVANAGLVLLWPFLPGYFTAQDLLQDPDFRDIAAQHRAVTLLHHLTTGERWAPEESQPLSKALAGVPLDAVLDDDEPLSDEEAERGETLLAAVLTHAPMLGKIGVNGLRSAFLLRPGSLAVRDGHWLLRPEKRTHDVLLNRLPWQRNWVVLPWMEGPLQVEW